MSGPFKTPLSRAKQDGSLRSTATKRDSLAAELEKGLLSESFSIEICLTMVHRSSTINCKTPTTIPGFHFFSISCKLRAAIAGGSDNEDGIGDKAEGEGTVG